ncbi:MAG: polysaccharide biosynthesis protein [Lactobacillus sp.]|nr:polysaccharide biosynthesis protein [Lactobacillus sp.]MDN6051943.1 polysaccharide biosynthesis protein [Lactobacillus sp.]
MNNNRANPADSQAKMLKGSAWMTFGSIISRVLGVIYIIPWYAWMGAYGNIANALTAKSYNIYSLFLIVSTAGIPGAVAKQIAKYNALDEYRVGQKLFKHGLALMALFGVLCAMIMYFAAPILAAEDLRQVPVLRSLAFAVVVIPVMSIFRGYFQGYSNMMPSAMSQFVEQLARVIWILLTAYVIMRVQHGNYLDAVTQSNLAAFVGAIFGILLLCVFYLRQKRQVDQWIADSQGNLQVSTGSLFLEIIQQSIPFIIIDSGITLYQLIDQYTFHPLIASFVHVSYDQIESWYALFGLNANKLIMVTVSIATAMAVTAIPLLSGAHAQKNWQDIAYQLENTLQLFFFVMIPASFGMAAVSRPIYTVFYGPDPLGTAILVQSAITAITLGFFTVLLATQQGLSENGLAIKYLLTGLVIKLVLQYPMILLFNVFGPLTATNVAMLLTIGMSLKHLHVKYRFNQQRLVRRILGMTGFSVVMLVSVMLAVHLFGLVLSPDRRLPALINVVISALLGAGIYVVLVLKSGLAEKVLGSRITRLRAKLHI